MSVYLSLITFQFRCFRALFCLILDPLVEIGFYSNIEIVQFTSAYKFFQHIVDLKKEYFLMVIVKIKQVIF